MSIVPERFVAFMIDLGLLGLLGVLSQFLFPNQNTYIIPALLFYIYICKDVFPFMSIGKKAMGLTILDSSTKEKSNFFQRISRNVFLILYPIEGLILLFFNKMRIGDIVANTVVVKVTYEKNNMGITPVRVRDIMIFLSCILGYSCFVLGLVLMQIYIKK